MSLFRPPDDETAWSEIRQAWDLSPSVTYLNHGSFGPSPREVIAARQAWTADIESNPMDFFVRKFEPAYTAAAQRLGRLVGSDEAKLVLLENATAGMNVVARSFPLAAGDEVLLTDHEYGAVRRIWQRACDEQGAVLRTVQLPFPPDTRDEVVAAVLAATTSHTRLVVASHITSPTALVLPIEALGAALRNEKIALCVDGPHAVASVPLDLDAMECDFYTASCHKWLSAPFGSGFLYVDSRWHDSIRPCELSWGRTDIGERRDWRDEFRWRGTRDPSALLAIPAAIDFLERVGLREFRARTHALARRGGELVATAIGAAPLLDVDRWHGPMVLVELPPGKALPLREALHSQFQIEVPVVEFAGRQFLRISCHLYNQPDDLERLAAALPALLR